MAFLPASRKLTRQLKDFISYARFDPEKVQEHDPAWPRITVITPSFNQAAFLERTILSIHNQDYPNLEHIVIDGGSDDGSVDILRRFEKRFSYWQSCPDKGQSDAINIGAGHSTGEYMMWINSDDMLLPGALKTLAEVFRKNPEADLVFGNQLEVDGSDTVTKRLFTIDFDIKDFLYEINIIVHQQSALWRTELFRKIGGLRLFRYAMDYDMIYRMYRAGARFRRIPDFLSAFRVHMAGLTGSGQVARNRQNEVDEAFLDFCGRKRNLFDRTILKYSYKTRRFFLEPRSLLAAFEHRSWLWTAGGKKARQAP